MGKHVVLVEDETNIAEAIRFLLGREGWRVETLANGATAVEVIRNASPDPVSKSLKNCVRMRRWLICRS